MPWSGRLILAAGSVLDQPAEMVIEAAAFAGFDGVGLRLSGEHAVERPERVRARVEQAGLTVFDVEVHRISADADPRPLLDAASAVGAEAVLVVSDLRDRGATIEQLHRVAAECRLRDLRLGLEYMAWTDPADPLHAVAMAESVGCEVLVDVLHHLRVGCGPPELAAVVASGRLGWVQLCDAPLAPPDGPFPEGLIREARHGRLAPGHGELPIAELLAVLPPTVTVAIEVQSDELLAVPVGLRAQHLIDTARRALVR
ncbi:MAG: sugar phosphate isomerase/epimerase [Acidimicrobiia bacterium]|nr:sugar phosphate isomerase/epimerase [Acidimicrobiia bacterium]